MKRAGAVLLELLVALAIFVIAATTLLGTFGDVLASIGRDTTTARAVDLARTRMSELEAGLITVEDLRTTSSSRGGAAMADRRSPGGRESESRGAEGLMVDATVTRSAYPGLSLIELRVFDGDHAEPRFTLRQLVALPRDRAAGETNDAAESMGPMDTPNTEAPSP